MVRTIVLETVVPCVVVAFGVQNMHALLVDQG
eukprot:SAG11_NODE_2286_length_3567_cov_3.374567_2_plen_32_part_00